MRVAGQYERAQEQVDAKLRETDFFFRKLIIEDGKSDTSTSEPEAFVFYLSAFLAASEALRNLLGREPFRFKWNDRPEPEKAVLNFMHEKRVLVAHTTGRADVEIEFEYDPTILTIHSSDLGGTPLSSMREWPHPAYPVYSRHVFLTSLTSQSKFQLHGGTKQFAQWGVGRRRLTYFFKENEEKEKVTDWCKRYLDLLRKLVKEFRAE
jgi:hypothetical protein